MRRNKTPTTDSSKKKIETIIKRQNIMLRKLEHGITANSRNLEITKIYISREKFCLLTILFNYVFDLTSRIPLITYHVSTTTTGFLKLYQLNIVTINSIQNALN